MERESVSERNDSVKRCKKDRYEGREVWGGEKSQSTRLKVSEIILFVYAFVYCISCHAWTVSSPNWATLYAIQIYSTNVCVCDAWVMRKTPMHTTPLPLSVWILLSVWEWTHTFLHQYASVCVSNAVALLWVPPSSSLLASVLSTPQSVDRHILYPLLLECSCFAQAYLWPPWMQLRKSCLSLEGKSSLEAFGGNCFMLKIIGFALCVSLG